MSSSTNGRAIDPVDVFGLSPLEDLRLEHPSPRSRAVVAGIVAVVLSIVAWQLTPSPPEARVITAGVVSGNLVMVTGNGGFTGSDDAAKKTLFEGFGWTVTAVDDSSTAGTFATVAAANDVLYYSDSSSTGSSLVRDLDIGVVAEHYSGWSNLLYAPSFGVGYSGQTQIDLVDTSHYITSSFSTGILTVYTASSDVNYWQSGSQPLPAGVTVLAESPTGAADKALLVAETGAALYSSNTAVNRRVWFPTDFAPAANYTGDLEDLLERSLEWASGTDLSATVTVNSTGDAVDNNIGDSRCDTGATNSAGADECTLRAAIAEANASSLVDTIEFLLPTGESGYTGSWWTIDIGAAELPRVTTDMTIDGATQTGYSSTPLVVVDGSAITTPANGDSLGVDSGTVTVRALSLVNAPDDGLQHLGSGSIEDTYTGLLPDGTTAGNGANGLNLVGTNLTVDGNVASANPIGVRFDGSGTVFTNNKVGTDPTGLLDRGNSNVGGIVIGATNLTIGGVGAGSVFSGNGADGLWVTGGSGLVIEGSFFGVGSDGTTAVPNGSAAIYEAVDLQTSTGSVRVGGTAAGAGNVLYGGGDGVRVGTAVQAAILGNSIYGNTGLGIDLNDDGVTANDAGDGDTGPNDYLNFPVITSATENSGTVSVDYELDVPAGDYRIEFFENPSGANASGYGEGEDFVHGVTVSHAGSGVQTYSTSFSGSGSVPLTATATGDLGGGSFGPTSEFSLAATTCVDDDGDGLCTHLEALFGDTDGDSFANSVDADDDGDSIATVAESADPNDDGDPRDAADGDRDGQPDYLDEPLTSTTGLVAAEQKISDIAGNGPDVAAGDGFGRGVASIGDVDGDGIVDALIGAQGGDDGGADRGEAHVLFLNSDGSVRASQKISSTTGGLNTASLANGDRFGQSVAGLGDIDGDAVPDIAVGARKDDDGGTARGAVYVLLLNTDGTVKAEQKISQSAGGGPGLDDNDEFGQSVAGLGDLDGDGINDLAIGAWFDDDGGGGRGAVYVAFLNADGSARATQKISSTAGGLTGPLDDNELFGVAVSGPGDVDGDGIEDLVVGASQDGDGGTNRGAVYVLFLNTDGTVRAEQKISSSAGGLAGPLGNGDKFGVGISGLGDLNRDGVPDIAVGAELDDDGGTNRGGLYLLFLDADGTVKTEQKISDTQGGFTTTLDNSDQFGNVVASLGDLDGDGSTSLLVGANADDDGGSGAGAAYVLELNGGCGLGTGYGSTCPFSSLDEVPLTAEGRFWFDFGNGPFEASVNDDEGGRWVLVLQYHHRGGTDPALDVRSTTDSWPSYAPAVQNVDRSGTEAWGHVGQAAAAAIPDSAGELELRWAAETSNHSRVAHFRSPVLGEFQGNGADNFFVGGINTNFTALAGHTTNLPGGATAAYSDQGDLALTNFSYYRNGAYHWGIDGAGYRWEIDDYNNSSAVDTVHQVWVRNGRIPAVVNSSGDSADQTPGDAICDTGGTNSEGDVECTLRAAIEEANASSLVDTVEFNLPASDTGHSAGVWTIRPTTALPTVSTGMKIDGSTQTGWSTDPVVAIQADLAGSTALSVTAADSEIRSLVVYDQSAIGLALTSADRTVVAGNWIGLDAAGVSAGGTVGLVISGGADVVIGGTATADRNVISGNGSDGVQVSGSPSGLTIVGNDVGVGTDGSSNRGNGGDGIQIVGGTGTKVGGGGTDEGNTIAYNGAAGIRLASSDDNPLLANSIYNNGSDGLDLGTANDNLTVPSPVSATVSGSSTAAVVDLDLPAGDYRLEFFSNPVGVDPSGGEGQIYRGAASVTHTGSGVEQFSTSVSGISIDDVLTVTATEDLGGGTYGSTSEFSTSITAVAIVPPVLKGIQSGSVTLADGASTVSVPIAAVDGTKSFSTFTYRGDHHDPNDLSVSGGLSDPTTLDFERVGTNGDVVIEWSVVEFTSGVSVQRGSVVPASATHDVTIAAVDQSTSFVLVNHHNDGTAFGADDFASGQLTSGTNLRLSSVDVTNQIEWQVVSYDGALVTRGTTGFGTGDLTMTETVPTVDLDRSWLVYSMTTDAGTTNDIGQKLIRGVITDTTTLTFDRHNSGQAATVAWELVQFPDGVDVQSGSAAFAAAATSSDVTITEVMPGRSLAVGGRNLVGGRTPYNTIDNIGVASFTADLRSSTNLRIQRSADDDEADLGWFVIHWPCSDSDGDGLCDDAEDANTDADADPSTNPGPDTDGDGTANYLDSDDDGDGTPTSDEQADPNGDGGQRDALDTDSDGEPDYLDVEAGPSGLPIGDEQKISDSFGDLSATLVDSDSFGFSVTPIGDVDGDGFTDVAAGVIGDDDGGATRGAVYVLFLNADGSVKAEQKISSTSGGKAPLSDADQFGRDVASLGDVDGDGIPDLAVGAIGDDDGGLGRGAVYVLFLNADGSVKAEQKISSTSGGLSGPLDDNDLFGHGVGGVGDLDGDGVPDLAVGVRQDDDGGSDRGAFYVLFLTEDGTVKAEQKVSDTAGALNEPLEDGDIFGSNLAAIGDLDGDGVTDLVVAAPRDDDGGTRRGALYVLFMNPDGTVKAEQKISDTAGGFAGTLADSTEWGYGLDGPGDVDGDGVPDVIAGSWNDSSASSTEGDFFVLLMKANGTVRETQRVAGDSGGLTGPLDSGDRFGVDLAGIGDLDGDGQLNLVVGAPYDDDGGGNRGAIYVLDLGQPTDTDGDGIWDHQEDDNADGDFDPSTTPGPDTDADTTADYLDSDDDGDGIPTVLEFPDPNGDGDPRDADDADRDGQADYLDAPTSAAVGTAASEQKISSLAGGLLGPLDDGDQFGAAVAPLGDLNGDGVNDLAIGARQDDDGGANRGAVYVLFLNADGTVNAEQKISSTSGGLLAALDDSDQFGSWVRTPGDLDGDGRNDLVVGAYGDDDGGENRGAVYVLFLNADGTVKTEQKISDTTGGLSAALDDYDSFGQSVGEIGDLNGDGVIDIVVGADGDDDGGVDRGAVYVLFLNDDGTVKAEQKISDTTGGLTVGLGDSGYFGEAVSAAGDVDGDGIGDIAVGQWAGSDGGTHRGAVYVLFMNTDGTVREEQKISDTAGGFTAVLDDSDWLGGTVSPLGDLDRDGTPDLLVGAPGDGDGGSKRGAVYVLLLQPDGTVKREHKISDTEGGFTSALADNDWFGISVAGIGDLDGDGTINIVVGSRHDDDGGSDRGAVYMIDLALPSDADGDGLWDYTEDGNTDSDDDPSTTPGPDTDGDGVPNYLDADDDGDGTPTAAESADPNGDGLPADALDLDRDNQPDYLDRPTAASDGTVRIQQEVGESTGGLTAALDADDRFGRAVASIGDLDGDGVNDLAVGARNDDDGGSDRGAVYVLFMHADGTVKAEQKISDTAGGLAATLDDGDNFGMSVAGLGDLDGDGIVDLAVGADADDDGGSDRGAVYVLFLHADGSVKGEQKISETVGGLTATLGNADAFGFALTNLGDLDGDGTTDLVAGARHDDDGGSNRGAVYVLFLHPNGTVKAEQKISDAVGGFTATLDNDDTFGFAAAGVGDLDGDSLPDLAVGAPGDDDGGTDRGALYLLFLNADGTVKAEQKISDIAGGLTTNLDGDDRFGSAVAGVGDIDGDATVDLAVGARDDDDGGTDRGAVYVLLLNADGSVRAEQKISSTAGGMPDVLANGDDLGIAIAGIGDVDGDGTIGLVVGAQFSDNGGSVHLLNLTPTVSPTVDDSSTRRGNPVAFGGLDPSVTTAGIVGPALSYDGADDRLVAPATDVTTAAVTLSGWIYATSFGTDPRIVAKAATDGNAIYELLVDDASVSAGSATARLKLGGSTYTVTGGSVSTGSWYQLVSVWDGSTLSLYVNGELVNSVAATGTLDTDLTVPLTVGNLTALDRGFNGIIDEVRVANEAPTAAKIRFEYNNASNPSAVVSVGGAQTGAADPWTVSSGQTRSGSNAARAPEITSAGRDAWLRANGIDEPGLEFTSWWWLSTAVGVDVAAGTRAGGAATNQYETAVTSSSGWDLASDIGGARTQQVAPAGTPTLGSWVEVAIRTDEAGNSTVVVDGLEVIAESAQGTGLLSGSAALRAGLLPSGQLWYVDDARVRKLIGTEPTATLGPLERN